MAAPPPSAPPSDELPNKDSFLYPEQHYGGGVGPKQDSPPPFAPGYDPHGQAPPQHQQMAYSSQPAYQQQPYTGQTPSPGPGQPQVVYVPVYINGPDPNGASHPPQHAMSDAAEIPAPVADGKPADGRNACTRCCINCWTCACCTDAELDRAQKCASTTACIVLTCTMLAQCFLIFAR